jgi:PKD domain-containing protein
MDCSMLVSSRRGRRLAIAAGTLIVACGAAFGLAGASRASDPIPGVQADFKWTPGVPVVGQTVTFESTSKATGLANSVADYRWDLDGETDNGYETGWDSTPVITTTFAQKGSVSVRLQVRDTLDNRSTIKKTVDVGGQAPVASYTFSPAAPLVNDPVTFTAVASDTDGTIAELVWDLNGDGVYDNGAGPTALRSFSAAGAYVVGLRATDNEGVVSFYSQTLAVAAPSIPAAAVPPWTLLSPFPVVRIAGRVSRRGVRLSLLSVEAPPGSSVQVRCKGRTCPFRRSARAAGVVRLRRLEKALRAGVVIRIYVTSSSAIGKYTSFKIRKRRAPLRADGCLAPDSLKRIPCPGGWRAIAG